MVAATATFLWGRMFIVPAVRRMDAIPLDPEGGATAEPDTETAHVKRVVALELVGAS